MDPPVGDGGVMAALAAVGWWRWDAAAGEAILSADACTALRVAPGTRLTAAQFAGLVADVVAGDQEPPARTDPLTGIPSRRVLLDALREGGRRATDERLALVLLDLDRFGEVNDRYGHRAGDAVLIEVAQRLRRTVRGGELIARDGGERFAWMLTGVTPEQATAAADRARAAIACRPFRGAGGLTLSAGVGVVQPPFDGALLYQLAERALADAKRQGRNRSCCALGVVRESREGAAGPGAAPAAAIAQAAGSAGAPVLPTA